MISYNKNIVKPMGDKKVLIFGFGREGRDTLLFLRKLFSVKTFGIADQNSNLSKYDLDRWGKIKLHLGKNYLKAIKQYDIIIKSPGISPKIVAPFTKKGQIITSQTEIFFNNCPGRIIGVTGTKGKSTTTALIHHILKKAGFKAHLVGNIGKPSLHSLLKAQKDDWFVYELSSHQLYGLKKSPHIGVLLDIYPEHLDYYRSFKEYALAKANICLWQGQNDYIVYNYKDKMVSEIVRKCRAKKIPVSGIYYELDKAAAKAVAKILKIPDKTIDSAIKSFKSLPHRLEFVGKVRGIEFYNDSLSTIPQSAIAALDFFGNRVQTLIVGGFDRGVSFKELAKRIKQSDIKTLILFPPSGLRIANDLNKAGFPKRLSCFVVDNMKQAVNLCFLNTQKGKICLLSPASASFGLFKDYADRGDRFKRAVLSNKE